MRAMSIKNIYEIKHNTLPFTGKYADVFGTPESCGTWIISGAEKNGKTWAAMLLANMLTTELKMYGVYVSGEQGVDADFVKSLKRAGIDHTNTRLYVVDGQEYSLHEIMEAKFGKRKKSRFVIIDNVTFYKDDLKNNLLHKLQRKYPDVLFIYLAHEEKGELYGATAKLCKKLAKVIMRAEGLQVQVSGRVPGGIFNIDDSKAQLYWGVNNSTNNKQHD
jgi:thymidine kinase